MLIYTSGSTGQPEGVMHAFGPISAVGFEPSEKREKKTVLEVG